MNNVRKVFEFIINYIKENYENINYIDYDYIKEKSLIVIKVRFITFTAELMIYERNLLQWSKEKIEAYIKYKIDKCILSYYKREE